MTPEELRKIAIAFLRLVPTQRAQIAGKLELDEGLEEMNLRADKEADEILRRVREAGKIEKLSLLLFDGAKGVTTGANSMGAFVPPRY
jgi:hypothetical protein